MKYALNTNIENAYIQKIFRIFIRYFRISLFSVIGFAQLNYALIRECIYAFRQGNVFTTVR